MSRGRTRMAYHIGTLPRRKSVMLYRIHGSVITSVAQFRSEDAAREFMHFVDRGMWPGGRAEDNEFHGWSEVE